MAAGRISGTIRMRAALAALGVAFALTAAVGEAQAIECRGPYQLVQGQSIATPYCQDNYLAGVAREYGTRVSNSEIRNNPNKKAEVCRFVGHDNRVSHICQQYREGLPSIGR